ncbi:MAG: helix-turn-helix transcriptional regulator [Actinomycetota bacterium]|nr:helix-turn-helix transcriptional regulator [Actinomycetota bacterium]
MQELQPSIGDVIAEQRLKQRWTQRELGEQLGIGTSLVAKWEQGIRVPPYEWLVELDRVLGTSLSANSSPVTRRRGPRPAIARSAPREMVSPNAPVLVEVTPDGVRVFQADRELETVVFDLRAMNAAPPAERVVLITNLLLRSLELPRPLADRLVRQLAELD